MVLASVMTQDCRKIPCHWSFTSYGGRFMNKFVTNRQIALMLYCIIVGYGVIEIPKSVAEGAGTGGWFSILVAGIIFIFITYVITFLQYVYEGKTLYEYSELLVGKFMTYIFLIICILYFFTYFTMLARAYAETIKITILNKTPVLFICMLLYIVVFYALRKGINVIGRVCEVYGFFNIVGIILVNFLLCTKGRLVNIRPLFTVEDLITYFKAIPKTILPFLGMEMLLFIPISRTNNKNIFKYTTSIVAFIVILYIYVVESTFSVVGVDTIVSLKATVFTIVRGVDIRSLEFFRRLDGLYVIYWSMNIVCAICLWGYGVIVFTSKIFKNIKYNFLVIIVMFLSFIVSQIPKTKDQVETILKYSSYSGILVFGVIPIILFIITKVKKYDKQI